MSRFPESRADELNRGEQFEYPDNHETMCHEIIPGSIPCESRTDSRINVQLHDETPDEE